MAATLEQAGPGRMREFAIRARACKPLQKTGRPAAWALVGSNGPAPLPVSCVLLGAMSAMPRLALALLATTALSAPALAQSPALAPHAAVFKGDRGLSVTVAPTADDKGALVRLQGINHPIDGVVFLADKISEGRRMSLRTTLDGRPWTLVISEDLQSWGGSYQRTQAYPPTTRDGVSLHYDEKASKALNLADLGKAYRTQKSGGAQEKLARFDRDKSVASAEARVGTTDAAATKACGLPIKTTIDWSGIDEERMKRLSVGSYCATVADAVARMCTEDQGFKSRAAGHAAIRCQFGDRLSLRQQDGKTVFTTAESAPNQGDFALQYLRNQ